MLSIGCQLASFYISGAIGFKLVNAALKVCYYYLSICIYTDGMHALIELIMNVIINLIMVVNRIKEDSCISLLLYTCPAMLKCLAMFIFLLPVCPIRLFLTPTSKFVMLRPFNLEYWLP